MQPIRQPRRWRRSIRMLRYDPWTPASRRSTGQGSPIRFPRSASHAADLGPGACNPWRARSSSDRQVRSRHSLVARRPQQQAGRPTISSARSPAVLKVEPQGRTRTATARDRARFADRFRTEKPDRNRLGIALPIGKFLQRPTIAGIAVGHRREHPHMTCAPKTESVEAKLVQLEMSIGQQALWFIDGLDPGNPAYALAACVAFRPHLNDQISSIRSSRTLSRDTKTCAFAFPSDGIGPVPTLLPSSSYRLTAARRTTRRRRILGTAECGGEPAIRPRGRPLSRLHLFRRSDRDVLLLQFHHIVADAASIAMLLDEVLEGYFALQAGLPLPCSRQRAHFGQFVAWQQALVSGPDGEQHRAYWRKQLAGAPASLPLATDYPRTANTLGPGAAPNFVGARRRGRGAQGPGAAPKARHCSPSCWRRSTSCCIAIPARPTSLSARR